jgi:hypothetical protein
MKTELNAHITQVNLIPYDWNVASGQAGMKNPYQVKNNNLLPSLQQGWE